MFVITVKFVINEKDIDKFKTRILQQARDSLELEKDCHEFDVCHDPNDQNVVFLYETYTDKDAFDILTRVPLKWKDNDYTQKTRRIYHSSAITLTKDKDYNDIRFSVATMDALDCHPDLMEQVYKVHHKFGRFLHDDKFVIKFRLEPGDIFSFNNRRVLHGRTTFNATSGDRHHQGYYMDRDEIIGRLNFLKDTKN